MNNVEFVDNNNEIFEIMIGDQMIEVLEAKEKYFDDTMIILPISGEISAGLPIESKEIDFGNAAVSKEHLKKKSESYLCMKVNGSSMEPAIKNGDVILLEKSTDWNIANNKICAIRIDGEITLKKVKIYVDENKVSLIPLNKDFEVMDFYPEDYDDFSLIGIMTFLYRKYI